MSRDVEFYVFIAFIAAANGFDKGDNRSSAVLCLLGATAAFIRYVKGWIDGGKS